MSNQIIVPSRERRQDQHLFIGGREIYGVQSVIANYSLGSTPLEYLGMTNTLEFPNSAQVGSVSINSLIVETDPLIAYTGNLGTNGYIVNSAANPGGQNFSFMSGYMTSYNVRCAIGQIPETSTEFLVVGDMGYLPSTRSPDVTVDMAAISAYTSSLAMKIASYGAIELNLDEFTTNRLQAFQLSISSPRNPIYQLGSRSPYLVDLIYPLSVDFSATLDVNDYLAYRLNSFPCTPDVRSLSVAFSDYSSGAAIISYSFANMRFQGMKYSTDISSNVSVELSFRSHIEAPRALIDGGWRADSNLVTADSIAWDASYYY